VRPTLKQPPRWPLLAIRGFAAAGLFVGVYLAVLHAQAGASGAINSPLCGLSPTLNCNSVLGSAYARLFGFPIADWAAVTYAGILVLSFLSQPVLLVLLCGWVFTFSLYMASLSLFVIQAACLFCITLYTVSIGLLVGAVALARSSLLLTAQQTVFAAVGYAVLLAGFGWQQAQVATVVTAETEPILAPAPTAVDTEFLRYYNSRPLVALTGEERYAEGPPQALLTITEFADFRCPQCARARGIFKQLMRGNPNDIRLIFHHYPLDSECNPQITQQVHPTSCAAAISAECAGEQGKFWDYADLLFADQREYTKADLEEFAKTLNLDMQRFQTCLTDNQIRERIGKDIAEAERIGLKATPTLIINGHFIEGIPAPNKLASLITVEKQRAGK
jgi:protein-disulfide isomerase